MSSNINGSPLDIMKAISMFDIDEDFDNKEARKKLDMLFHELIMSNDSKSKEFLSKFLDNVENIIADMGVIVKPVNDETNSDDVEFPDDEDSSDDEDTSNDEDNDNGDSSDDEDNNNNEDEIPDEILSNYNPLIDSANSFIYV